MYNDDDSRPLQDGAGNFAFSEKSIRMGKDVKSYGANIYSSSSVNYQMRPHHSFILMISFTSFHSESVRDSYGATVRYDRHRLHVFLLVRIFTYLLISKIYLLWRVLMHVNSLRFYLVVGRI